jgi:hypothetical protein
LADICCHGGVADFKHQVDQGVHIIQGWTDLAAPLKRLSGAVSSEVPLSPQLNRSLDYRDILWLASYAASVLPSPLLLDQAFIGSKFEDTDWRSLWRNSVLASSVTPNGKVIPQTCSAPIHVMVALALDFGFPFPLGYAVNISSIHEASIVLAGCLAPLQSIAKKLPEVLPASLIPHVREWLLDGLSALPDPYTATPWIPMDEKGHTPLAVSALPSRFMLRREKYLGRRPLDWTGSYRDELAWALDHTTAVLLKREVGIGFEHIPTLDRLGYWSAGDSALMRTYNCLESWPDRPPKKVFDPVEPLSVTDLICANAQPYVLIDLVKKKKLISSNDVVEWLRRANKSGEGNGGMVRLLSSPQPMPHLRAGLVRHVFSLLKTQDLPCENGNTAAHLILERYPIPSMVTLVARIFGVGALMVENNSGNSAMDVSRMALLEKHSAVEKFRAALADMELALLKETKPTNIVDVVIIQSRPRGRKM